MPEIVIPEIRNQDAYHLIHDFATDLAPDFYSHKADPTGDVHSDGRRN
jgi:hypothetical protein